MQVMSLLVLGRLKLTWTSSSGFEDCGKGPTRCVILGGSTFGPIGVTDGMNVLIILLSRQ